MNNYWALLFVPGTLLDVSHTVVDDTHGTSSFLPKRVISAMMESVLGWPRNSCEKSVTWIGGVVRVGFLEEMVPNLQSILSGERNKNRWGKDKSKQKEKWLSMKWKISLWKLELSLNVGTVEKNKTGKWVRTGLRESFEGVWNLP